MILAKIKGQSLRVSYPTVVADTIDYLSAEFEFLTADWNGLEKWAHFRQGDVIIDIRLKDDKIIPTDSLNLSEGKWELFLHGNTFENGEVKQRITTNTEYIFVERFGKLEGEPFPDSPPTAIEDIYAEIDELKKHGGGAGSGENGATFTPSVSDDGVISWTNDKGLPNPESKNIKGGKGDPFKYEDFTPEQLEALKGKNGKSAYELAVDDGFEGTEAEWLASLKGDPYTLNEQDKQTIVDAVLDEVPTVETAEVGQTIVVKAVDENGKPTEWEAADFPSGDDELRHINTITLEEDTQGVYVDVDSEGKPFDLKYLVINVYSVGAEGNTNEARFKIEPNVSGHGYEYRLVDLSSGIRKSGSTRSMTFVIMCNGMSAYGFCSSADNIYKFDDNMKFHNHFGEIVTARMYGCSSIKSLLLGTLDNPSINLGKGSKIAIWGR